MNVVSKCDHCNGRGLVGEVGSMTRCEACMIDEVSRYKFSVSDTSTMGPMWDTDFVVVLSEWADGTWTVEAESESDWKGYWHEWGEIVYDHAPTADEVLTDLLAEQEARAEAYWESRYSPY